MPTKSVQILDDNRNVVATANVEVWNNCYTGSVDVARMPEPLRRLFEEYEEIVNNQMFSLLDQIEDRIDNSSFSVVFDDGCESPVKDLQIFPKGGTVSFQVIEPAMLRGSRSSA